ncbi:MAG: F0F1 ATP synthase subunit epsilon [Clostridia bacterium]|nr:F0F1 ATP synthase subunit epsilon [Clostridia bacterium]
MNTYHLIIASPDGNIFEGEVSALFVRGKGGDLAVLKGHIPFITPIVPCVCRFIDENGNERAGTTNGGLLTVTADSVTLLSDTFSWS